MSTLPDPKDLKALLQSHGFPHIKAQVWSEFVCHALALYWQAADQLLEPARWDSFKKKVGALGKPKKLKGEIVQLPIEDAITSEIGALAEQLRKALPSGHFLRLHETHFEHEALVASDTRSGRHSKKIDFRVFSQLNQTAPDLSIEAKPVITAPDINNRYLAAEGIGCFFSIDSPYTRGPIGAMLAYTIDTGTGTMQSKISMALASHTPAPLHIHTISIPCTGPIDCSHHDRTAWKLNPITILHLERCFPPDIPGIPSPALPVENLPS